MARNKRIFKSLTLIAALAILAACAAPATPTAAPTAVPATSAPQATAAPTSGQAVTVQYWSNGWVPASIGARKAVVDKFNQEYKGRIQVEYIQGGGANQATYIQAGAAAAGGIACVMETYMPDAVDFYRKGYTQDLKAYLTADRRALADEIQWQNRTYPDDGAVVASVTVLGEPILTLLYNPDALQKAGVQPATADKPWTWQQLFDNAKLLTIDANGKHLGEAGFDNTKVVQWGYLSRLAADKVWENGILFAQDRQGKAVVRQENGKWGWFLDASAQDVYKTYLSPVQLGIAPPEAIGMSGEALEQIFGDGKAAIVLRETFEIPVIQGLFPGIKIGVMPIPAQAGDHVYYAAGGEGMVITKSCKTPAEAAEFMFFVMRADNAATYAYGNGMLPGNLKGLDQEPFKSDKNYDVLRAYLTKAESFSVPFNPHMQELEDTVVGPLLLDVATGKKTFDEAEKTIEEPAATILNQQ